MAFTPGQGGTSGTETFVAERTAIFTAIGTDPLKTGRGKLGKLIVTAVGTTATVDIYDDPAAANNKVASWVSADGKVVWDLQIPMQRGITVVTTGTLGTVVVTFS